MEAKFSARMELRTNSSMELCWMLLEVALHRNMSLQFEEGAAKRVGKFCPSDSVRPTDGLHAFNACSSYVNNHVK